MDTLVADPHILYAYVNDEKPWVHVLCEMIDNSFAQDAGNANHVTITLLKDSISVMDDGYGIDDINKLATPGRSGSYSSPRDIGQYGQGAKSWLGKAYRCRVETSVAGRLHYFTFDAKPIHASLRRGVNTQWLKGYVGKGEPHGGPSFTKITMLNLRSRKPILVDPICAELARRFWPALKAGKKIELIDERRARKQRDVVMLQPRGWTKQISFESSVNGKRYSAKVGVLSEVIGDHSGLFIGYIYRNIVIQTSLLNESLPPRIHGQVELSEDWRKCFSMYKDEIVRDKDELLDDLRSKLADLIKQVKSEAENIKVEQCSQFISTIADAAINRSPPKSKPADEGLEPSQNSGPNPNAAPKRKLLEPKLQSGGPKEKVKRTSGLKIARDSLGPNRLENVSVTEQSLEITLNSDMPALNALFDQPRWPGVTVHIGSALAAKAQDMSTNEIERVFWWMLGNKIGTGIREEYFRAIRIWWAERSFEAMNTDTRLTGLKAAMKMRKQRDNNGKQ